MPLCAFIVPVGNFLVDWIDGAERKEAQVYFMLICKCTYTATSIFSLIHFPYSDCKMLLAPQLNE